jgi:cephalosporin hydroxylase
VRRRLKPKVDAWAEDRVLRKIVGATGNYRNVRWLGTVIWQSPFDAWILQEMISDLRPEVIVETGTWEGGSAYYFACICDLLGHGEVISIDLEPRATIGAPADHLPGRALVHRP